MKAAFLSRFTPSLMTPEALETTFVQREALAQRIVELIRDSALTPSKHHTLLIGPRGIGKTHLIALTYHRILAMDDLRDRLLIAWLREEEWGVTSFLDLLLRLFRSLRVERDDAALAERVQLLYNLPPDAAERVGGALLKEFLGNRTLLILVENLDDMFEGLGDEGQKRLRSYLQENPFCTILATAQSLFNGVSLQTSPFYGFFRLHHLEGLDFDDATCLLTKIANFEGERELVSFISTPMGRARIRAVHHLAGGNHRVYVIFSQFLTRESFNELVEPLLRTLDDLTPYYQARIAWLSPQQRKIVEFLCDRRHAVPVKEIAQHCFMTHQTTSSQLKTLREMGYVHSIPVSRDSYYELREPLMRLCIEVKKHRGEPIRLLVDFLRLWYSRTELQEWLTLLQPDAVLEREYLHHALRATEEETEDPRVAACLKDYSAYDKASDFASALEAAEELVAIRGHAHDWLKQGRCLDQLGRWEETITSWNKAIELGLNYPDNVYALAMQGLALGNLGRWDEALVAFNNAIKHDLTSWPLWSGRGFVLGGRGRWDEALASFGKAIELNPNYGLAWYGRGRALDDLRRHEEALSSFDKAIELGEQSLEVFFSRAGSLLVLNRWDEGLSALDDALRRSDHDDEHIADHTGQIVRNLFNSIHDATTWRNRITTLIELYHKHQVLSALGQGLVRSISLLPSLMVSDAAARMWRDEWKTLADDRVEFELPLRLLDAAVRYRETQDPRVLLKLPVEERILLEPLLKVEELQGHEHSLHSLHRTQQRGSQSRHGSREKTGKGHQGPGRRAGEPGGRSDII